MAAAAPVLVHVESIQTAVPSARRRLGPFAAHRRRSCSTVPVPRFTTAAARAARERAVWVKESLSAALVDHPEMASSTLPPRRRRAPPASAKATRAAFLEARGATDRETKERGRVGAEPDMCATFFMQLTRHNNVSSPSQLTRFPDGGYGIGASCSLLLADPLSLIGFLKGWQARGAAGAEQARAAAKRVKSAPLDTATDDTTPAKTATVIFRAADDDDTPDHHGLAAACVANAGEGLDASAPVRFTVMAQDGSGGLNVQTFMEGDGDQKPCRGHGRHDVPRLAHWRDEAFLEDLAVEGSKPVRAVVRVSYYVSPCADEALVVVMPGGGDELLISATVQGPCATELTKGPNFQYLKLPAGAHEHGVTVRKFRHLPEVTERQKKGGYTPSAGTS
ncbi:hypothetical protein HU200_032723 [Digitaria exilis]|uniref:Uncharacterized protein n=1 Tax=Digitaria exilis TaxID=1010633 RepID=A0A835BKT1_9POAL|nr:hypothetical protein HU200_032723 [Digitaria exilis]